MNDLMMAPYEDALQEILDDGVERTNERTGIKTLSVFGMMRRYRLDGEYFPILTRRKMWPKSVWSELLWLLSGSTNNKDLEELGCKFWRPWVDEEFTGKHGYASGVFGPVYGFQLRHFGGTYGNGIGGPKGSEYRNVTEFGQGTNNELDYSRRKARGYGDGGFDQLKWVVERIKQDHSCRRTLWTLWNPKDVGAMKLPPCHMLTQILVDDERRLSMIMYQRSCDFPVGVPANIQFYSALAIMIAQQTNCTPFEFIHFTADSHIYWDQIDKVEEYFDMPTIPSPKLKIKKAEDIFSYKLEDFELTDFETGPKIDFPVAV